MTFLYIIVDLVIIFNFINGFHDSANSTATVVSTKVLSPFSTVLLVTTFNFIVFVVFPLRVAKTMGIRFIILTLVQYLVRNHRSFNVSFH